MTKNERAKKFLRSYKDAAIKLSNTVLAIEELRATQYGTSIKYSDMPKAHNITDLSSYAARLDELERKLESEQIIRLDQLERVRTAIESVDNAMVQRVLYLRYIQDLKWEDILTPMRISWKTVHNYHAKGLVLINNYLEETNYDNYTHKEY